ncbi:hypothetical protein [Actinacidiphila oryziradicis]|uniref:Uncharacterized protein n=1 Tax=Actinacidiphila oryziradicis TaxID=2571141 RepID=A0A4U0SMR8_9ACTN|nr:hypothetical protein FCI23_12925 [Actinacidiphila oryziradicis]
MQAPDQRRLREPAQSQSGQQRAAIGIEVRAVGATDVVLCPRDSRRQRNVVGVRVKAGVVMPARQSDQHFQGLVHAFGDQPSLALGAGVEHRPARAHEVRPARIVPRHRPQRPTGYLDRLENTHLTRQISSIIEEFRDELPRQRPPRTIPH